MHVALTHNLKRSAAVEEAEFDTPETIAALCEAVRAAGHTVTPIEVSGPLESWLGALQRLRPDVILNTAEGREGPARTALFPAVFAALDLRFAGSDARGQLITQDKHLTKACVAAAGVPVTAGTLVTSPQDPLPAWSGAVILKPNFEGSSKGITEDSVIEEPARLAGAVAAALRAFPDGILIEAFVPGTDVTVGFIEGRSPEILTPCSYVMAPEWTNRHRLYDFRLKNVAPDEAVQVACPAAVAAPALATVRTAAAQAVRALGLRGIARLDFRVRDDGAVFFVEANATPSLEPGSSLFVAARRAGLDFAGVIAHLIAHAAVPRRQAD